MRTPRSVGFLLATVAVIAVSGCTISPGPNAELCIPQLTVEPAIVRAGESISVWTNDRCNVDVPSGGWVVIAAPVGDPGRRVEVTTKSDIDGSFAVELTLPGDFPDGDAFAAIENWDYSLCEGGGSCTSASGDFVVVP